MIPSDADLQAAIDLAVGMGMTALTGTDTEFGLAAMSTAWEMTEDAIKTNILATGTDCEVMDRPTGWNDFSERRSMVQLMKHHLVSVESVTITHDQFECDCDDETVTGCAHIHNEKYSHLRIEDCLGPAACACSRAGRPTQLEICYTAGLWGSVAAIPRTVILALGLAASYWQQVMATGGAAASGGFIDQWRSMDYSESRGLIVKNAMGEHPMLAAAWKILRNHRTVRGVAMRGYYHTQQRAT